MKHETDKSILNWRKYENAKCPKCDSANVAKILYGKPIWCDELKMKLDCGEITLGGCIINPDCPIYKCNDCKKTWGRLYDENEMLKKLFDHIKEKQGNMKKQ